MNNRGFTLVDAVVGVGMAGIAALGAASIIQTAVQFQQNAGSSGCLSAVRARILGTLSRDPAWISTVTDTSYSNPLGCLSAANCAGTISNFKIEDPYHAGGARMVIFDPVTSVTQGAVTGPLTGFTTSCTPCVPVLDSSSPPNPTTSQCPIQLTITMTAQSDAGSGTPSSYYYGSSVSPNQYTAVITGLFTAYISSTYTQLAGANVARYDFIFPRNFPP